jgi:hypothetical protein
MVPNTEELINPIQQIVSILGSLETWPVFILKLLFIDDYSILHEFMILNFFYGNKVPLDLALSVYTMCGDRNYFLAVCHFNVFYRMNDMQINSGCVCEVCPYYDIQNKKVKWINRENPDFEQREILLGIENTGHAEVSRARIQMMCS